MTEAVIDPWLGGESERLSDAQRLRIIRARCEEQRKQGKEFPGCECGGCKAHPSSPCPLSELRDDTQREKFLTPHHLERGPADHHLSNTRAYCWPCNRAVGKVSKPSTSHREKENFIAQGVGEPPESVGDVATRINEKNESAEPAFREFIIEQILKFGKNPSDKVLDYLKPSELIYAGSEWTDANPKTCYPYLARMTNKINGFIKIARHKPTNRKYLVFRYDELYDMNVREIVALHPKKGMMYNGKSKPQPEEKQTA